MNPIFKFSSLVFIVALSTTASAQTTAKSRAQVKAETLAATRSGDVTAPGDSGKSLREQRPERYAPRKEKKAAVKVKGRSSSVTSAL